jgi:hypothetical protein
MAVSLHPDSHESCVIRFTQEGLSIQIDLDANADRILLGTELGRLTPGTYRERVFKLAMCANGMSQSPRGVLAFSEKNDTLVLFQFLPLTSLNGEKLYHFLQLFHEHAKIWHQSLQTGDIPTIQEESTSGGEHMFGLRP